MLHFDSVIHLSDLLIAGGMLVTVFTVFIKGRDVVRDLTGTVSAITKQVERIDLQQQEHHEWLIRDGMDRRTGGERREFRHANGK